MSAATVAAALGGARHEGRRWRCRCPLHGGRSLVIADGAGGRLLVTCWAGCDRLAILAELRRRHLFDGVGSAYRPPFIPTHSSDDDLRRTARALKIWDSTQRNTNTIVAQYLKSRKIVPGKWPPSLRFSPRCPRPADDGSFVPPLPAMVALVEHFERGSVAVHCTYLRTDGSGKADLPKNKQRACFGRVGGGAVRFGMPRPGEWFAVAEGIETALSIAMACEMPAWAALSSGGIKNLVLPPEATNIVICADNDDNGIGERAAHEAAARWLAEDRRTRIAMPPERGTDFNDVFTGRAWSKIGEAYHVA
jgi:putative DNA primase/helicase